MKIILESLLEGAKRAEGAVAVIDVFRAFTCAALALANGATHITMVASAAEALALRAQGGGDLCMGEEHGYAPEGFDFGNSPYQLSKADVTGKSIIQSTTGGARGIVAAAARAKSLFAASLVTAKATAHALQASGEEIITLVPMGAKGVSRTMEDEICALHLRNVLEGRAGDADAVRRMILSGKEAADFGNPAKPYLPAEDLPIALDVDRYDFAVKVTMEKGRPVARKTR